jgi:long-subunit fatty acid transport protein
MSNQMRIRRRRWTAYSQLVLCGTLVGSASAAVSNPSFGSSPVPVGAGPRALGMGGAFSAVADDATAATWNPAGMSQLERVELGASVGWYHRRVQQDGGTGGDDSNSEVDLDHVSAIVPFYALGCQQTLAFAWQRQFDFGRSVSASSHVDDGMIIVDQFTEVEVDGAWAGWALSYALELHPVFSLGITVQAWGDALTGRSSYTRDVRETNTIEFFSLPASVATLEEHRETEVQEGYSAVLGLWWQALAELTVSMVVKPTYRLRLVTDSQSMVTTDGVSAATEHQHFNSDFYYPTSATLGLAWRQGDLDTIACDATWTQWSRYRVSEDGRTSSPVNSFIPYDEFDDGISLRLGYEHLMLFDEMVTALRFGALYEELPGAAPAPSADQPASTHAVIDRYYGVTAGTSLYFDHLLYDLGAQLRYGREVGTGQDAPPDKTADVMTITVRLGIAYQF